MADSTVEVDINTDDLNEFEALFHGKAKMKEEVTPVDENDETEAEDELEEVEEAEAEAEADETEAEAEEEEDILKPKRKNRQTAKERISEITAEKHAAERQRDETLAKFRELEVRFNQLQTQTPAPQAQPSVADTSGPNPTALNQDGSLVYPLGEYDPAFIRDITRYSMAKETEAFKAQLKAEQEAQAFAEAERQLQANWEVKLTEAEKEFTDLRPTIQSLQPELVNLDPGFGTYLAQTIMGMEVGPQVLYYLANHKDEARKIVAAGPVNATLALGRLEARIEGVMNKRATSARPTKAPEPAPAVRGTGARQSIRADTDNLEDFEKVFYKKR